MNQFEFAGLNQNARSLSNPPESQYQKFLVQNEDRRIRENLRKNQEMTNPGLPRVVFPNNQPKTVNPNASPLKGQGPRKNAQMGKANWSDSNLQPRGQGPARAPQQGPGPEGGPELVMDDRLNRSGLRSGAPGNDFQYRKGPFAGMTLPEAYQSVMDEFQAGSRGPERAAANLGFSRTDTEGRPIRPDYGYSRYGEAQDLDPTKVNPYRAFSTSGSGFKSNTQYAKKNPFQLRSEAERRERVDHYHFFDRQDANERQAQAASAVRARKQQQQADREKTQMDIAEYGSATDRDGLTRYYNREARKRAGKAVGAARRAHDKGLSMEKRRAAAGDFKYQSMMGEAEQNVGPGIREVQIAPEYGGGYGQSTRGFETDKPDLNRDYETRSGVPMSGSEAFSTDKVPGFTGIYDTGRQGRGAKGMAKALLDAGSKDASTARGVAAREAMRNNTNRFRQEQSTRGASSAYDQFR